MFEDAQLQIQKILDLVKLCPEELQEKCFEILLNAYVDSLAAKQALPPKEHHKDPPKDPKNDAPKDALQIPEAIRNRLVSTAARLNVTSEQLARLFDFSTDPFSFHAMAVPGSTKAEKTKNVALLLAAKSYLSGAGWTADWKEFRANCVDQNCFDRANTPTIMRHNWFKSGSAEAGVALSSAGITAAEALIARIAAPNAPQP